MQKGLDIIYYYHGKQYCEPGYCWGPGVKDHYKILFIHDGKGTYQINGQTSKLKKGQGFMVFPDTICCMKADEQEPWVYSWIAFHGDSVKQLLEQVQLSKEQPYFSYGPANWFDPWLEQLNAAQQLSSNNDLVVHSSLFRLLAEWINLLTTPQHSGNVPKAKELYVRKALDFIHTNFYSKVSISELASLIGIDRIYLSSLFKEYIQQSPQAYLLQFRMNKACELMSNPMLTLSDISRSVGYSDPLLFSKMFKKVKGVSPSEYRRNMTINVVNI